MSVSNIKPVYPDGIFPWTDRIDQQDIDFAGDINSAVAEIESVENTLGTLPQVESNPPKGNPVVYSTVSSRISDAMNNSQMPFVSLSLSSFTIPNVNSGVMIPYHVNIDQFNCYNGSDITAPASGWWIVTSTQTWTWWDDGFSHHMMCLNGSSNILHEHILNWEFPGNISPVTSGSQLIVPRWWQFGKRSITTDLIWQGALHKGDRLSVFSENGTSNAAHAVINLSLKATMTRTITGNFTSG